MQSIVPEVTKVLILYLQEPRSRGSYLVLVLGDVDVRQQEPEVNTEYNTELLLGAPGGQPNRKIPEKRCVSVILPDV